MICRGSLALAVLLIGTEAPATDQPHPIDEEFLIDYFWTDLPSTSWDLHYKFRGRLPDDRDSLEELAAYCAAPDHRIEVSEFPPESLPRLLEAHARYPSKAIDSAVGSLLHGNSYGEPLLSAVRQFLREHPQVPEALSKKIRAGAEIESRTEPEPTAEELYGSNRERFRNGNLAARCNAAEFLCTSDLAAAYERREARSFLQWLVEDGSSRALTEQALRCLLTADWSGRDDWFFDWLGRRLAPLLEADAIAAEAVAALVNPRAREWMPRLSRELRSAGPVRDALVEVLSAGCDATILRMIGLPIGNLCNEQVVELLIPWLEDPSWSSASYVTRLRVLQNLDTFTAPAVKPVLVDLMTRATADLSSHELVALVDAIRHHSQDDPSWIGVEAVQAAWRAGILPTHVDRTIADWGILSVEEHVEGALRCPAFFPEETGDATFWRVFRARVEEGHLLQGEAAIDLLHTLIEVVPAESDGMAIEAIARGVFDVWALRSLLCHRDRIRANTQSRAADLVARGDAMDGFFAALYGNYGRIAELLREGTRTQRLMLLGSARLGCVPLPSEALEALYHGGDEDVRLAITSYLASVDTAAARATLLALLPDRYLMLGSRQDLSRTHFGPEVSFSDPRRDRLCPSDTERAIVESFSQRGAPDEAIALYSDGGEGGDGSILIERRGEQIRLLREPEGGEFYLGAVLPYDQWKWLMKVVAEAGVFELPDLETPVLGGWEFQLTLYTPKFGLRRYMSNPSYAAGSPYHVVVWALNRLVDLYSVERQYHAVDRAPGAAIVYRGQMGEALAVERTGENWCVALPGESRFDTISSTMRWHELKNGQIGAPVDTPSRWRLAQPSLVALDSRFYGYPLPRPWGAAIESGFLATGQSRDDPSLEGLFRVDESGTLELLEGGKFSFPVTDGTRKWCLVREQSGAKLVRFRLENRRVERLDCSDPLGWRPILWLDLYHGVLCSRARQDAAGIPRASAPATEYAIYDPAADAWKQIDGDASLLERRSLCYAPLQARRDPHVLWALDPLPINDLPPLRVSLGRYDLRTFEFQPALEIERLFFREHQMCVSEEEGVVRVAVNGDVLSFPLPSPEEAPRGDSR